MSSPSALRHRGSLQSPGEEVDHEGPEPAKVMKAGPPSRANTATTDEISEDMDSIDNPRLERGFSDVSSGSMPLGSDSEGWTEEQEADYHKMRAAFEEEQQQRKEGEDWIFVFALIGFLVCGTVAALLPKYLGVDQNYIMAGGMMSLIGFVGYTTFLAPLLGCAKADNPDDDEFNPSIIFVIGSAMGVMVGGLLSGVVKAVL